MWSIRPVCASDAAAIAAIYAPIVERTAISFEEVPPSDVEMRARIEMLSPGFPWLVAEVDDEVAGYAYASRHRERAAYRWSADVSAYVHSRMRRAGAASALYRALFGLLEALGYRNAFAGITLPNDASVGLHRAMGFEPVGIYREVGYKLGAWRDTSWWRRAISALSREPDTPMEFCALPAAAVERLCAEAAASLAVRSRQLQA